MLRPRRPRTARSRPPVVAGEARGASNHMGSMLRAAPALPPSFSLHSAVAASAGRRALSPLVAALCAAAVGCAPSQNAAAHESDTAAAVAATATSSPALSAD